MPDVAGCDGFLGELRVRLSDFEPRDTIPWAENAPLFLKTLTPQGFAGFRTFAEIERHLDWLRSWAGKDGTRRKILDLGCGPGLYAHGLAKAGHEVIGVDIAAAALDYARQAAARAAVSCEYVEASLLSYLPAGAMDLVLVVNSIIGHLDAAEIGALMRRVQGMLSRLGRFLCEFPMCNLEGTRPAIVDEVRELVQSPWASVPHTWRLRRLMFPASHERVTHHIVEIEGRRAEYWSREKLYHRDEIEALFGRNGLSVVHVYGGEIGREHQSGDEVGLVWARRTSSRPGECS